MKKTVSIILCAALALAALTACGSTAAPTPTAEPVQTAEPTPEATPEPTAEPTPTPTAEPTPEPVTDPLVMYKDVYAQALTNNYGGEELIGSEISLLNMYCYEGNALDNVGYIFLDLDGDGTMELFIGAIGGDEFVANAVFDFYTYQDGHPVLLIDSMERARCYICDDNTLVIDGANSAFNTEYSCYSYANGTLTEIEPVESAYQQLDYTPHITSLFDFSNPAKSNEGVRSAKYEYANGLQGECMDNDYVVYRYADVLMMKGEALVRQGHADLAVPLFNEVRHRTGLDDYKASDLTLDEIYDERGREFAW